MMPKYSVHSLDHAPNRGNIYRIGQIDHDLDHLDPNLHFLIRCAGSVEYRSNPGNISYIIQISWLPPGNGSYRSYGSGIYLLPGNI